MTGPRYSKMNDERDPQTLVDQKQALDVYLRALLQEPEVPLQEEAPAAAPTETETREEAPVEAPAPEAEAGAADVIPEWGRERFQAMLFKVAGLTLAVPLAELSGVQEWDPEAVTPMPGHAEWYLGLIDYRGHSVPVVDTCHLVLPEDRRGKVAGPAERVQRVVFIGDGRWGLACDEVNDVITLAPDQVRWRTSRTRRRWLAGTVIDHMCALLDPPAFAQMLATGMEDEPGSG